MKRTLVREGEKINVEVNALRQEIEGKISKTGNSFTITIPKELMEHKGGFINKLGILSKIPIVDRETGRKGFLIWYKLPDSLTKDGEK